jgi:hypothetical protein
MDLLLLQLFVSLMELSSCSETWQLQVLASFIQLLSSNAAHTGRLILMILMILMIRRPDQLQFLITRVT